MGTERDDNIQPTRWSNYFLTKIGGKWYIYFYKRVNMPKGIYQRKPHQDIVGRKFNKLTVLNIDGKGKNSGFTYLCLCDCGNTRKNVLGYELKSGRAKSCGCDYPICSLGIGLSKEEYYSHTKKRLFLKRKINDECWEWTGVRNNKGYGFISWGQRDKKRKYVVSRIAYTIWKGEIPEGMMVCHSCDNSACFNPDHLWLGTQFDNMQDCVKKGRGVDNSGSKCGMSKLDEEQVLEIRRLRIEGQTLKMIADKFCVTDANISSICKRHTWRHI